MDDMENRGVARVNPEGPPGKKKRKSLHKPEPDAESSRKTADEKDSDSGGLSDKPEDSLDSDRKAADEAEGKSRKDENPASKLAKAGQAVKTGADVYAKLSFLNYLQAFLKMMMQMVAAVGQAVAGLAATVMGFVATAAASVATALGITVLGATFGIVGVVAVIVVVVTVAVASAVSGVDPARVDVPYEDCRVEVVAASTGDLENLDAITYQNAVYVYSVMKTLGLPDENIAGIVGNWAHESGIDPTGVETVYNERFQLGAKKQEIIAADYDIRSINPSYAAAHPAIDRCGIGLGQWTNDRNQLLLDYANAAGLPWYSLELQLAFCIAPASSGGDSRSGFFGGWSQEMSPEDAADSFCVNWEGVATGDDRRNSAAEWFMRFGEMSVDVNYANSIIEMAGTVISGAADSATGDALRNCKQMKVVDNGTLSMAGVSIAWETEDMSRNNNGTQTYQRVHDAVLPGDTYYMSCDRTVATAVRWSGTDDSYPGGDVYAQLMYLSTSPKWQEVTGWDGRPESLYPGDILIRKDATISHTVLYVGNQAVKRGFPDVDDALCVVSGSYGERSPGCGYWYANDTYGYNTYRVFRNIQKETDSVYKDAGLAGSY